jgi:BirA family biotin operon repressor/biotin-[acetyl-CoA-carboxylase] ligase
MTLAWYVHLWLQWRVMDEVKLRSLLPVAGLGMPLHMFDSTGSTNDVCVELARSGAEHGTLVVADAQTAGRGRGERDWITLPGSALAMSILLRPQPRSPLLPGYFTLIGALAVVEALAESGVESSIKWPNDVVVEAGKLAGTLAEASWSGKVLEFVVLGIGVNVTRASLPPHEAVDFPAACVELVHAEPVERELLLARIVGCLAVELNQAVPDILLRKLEAHLAYRELALNVEDGDRTYSGRIDGLLPDGRLRIKRPDGEVEALGLSAHIRPVDL